MLGELTDVIAAGKPPIDTVVEFESITHDGKVRVKDVRETRLSYVKFHW
jgi:hypothetical protein